MTADRQPSDHIYAHGNDAIDNPREGDGRSASVVDDLAEVWSELRGAEALGFVAEVQPEVAELMLNERDALLCIVEWVWAVRRAALAAPISQDALIAGATKVLARLEVFSTGNSVADPEPGKSRYGRKGAGATRSDSSVGGQA